MIGKLFHLAHVVDNLDATDKLYDEVFACQRFYRGYDERALRDSSLVVVSDQCMEPMAPSSDPAHAHSLLGRFKSRFGYRLHSIAWYVDDIKSFTSQLLKYQIRLFDIAGRPITQAGQGAPIFTHRADTGVLLEFCQPGYAQDPRLQPGWTTSPWRDHPLGLLRTSHVTVLLNDVARARHVYGDALGGKLLHSDTSDQSITRMYFAIGEDTVIEAAVPSDPSTPEGRDLAAVGSSVYAVTFASADLRRAAKFLAEMGIATTPRADGTIHIDLASSHGVNLFLTDRAIPGDTRK